MEGFCYLKRPMADFDLKDTILTRLGENYDLHDKYANRTLVKVQRTIGFDKIYARAEGAYLYDLDVSGISLVSVMTGGRSRHCCFVNRIAGCSAS